LYLNGAELASATSNSCRKWGISPKRASTIDTTQGDEAFREVLLTDYDYACAICEMKFVVDNLHEAQAAHIVPKNKNGTDDPRNGLTLCRAHHWALDAGLFTLTPDTSGNRRQPPRAACGQPQVRNVVVGRPAHAGSPAGGRCAAPCRAGVASGQRLSGVKGDLAGFQCLIPFA
jgi:hypothetical protein